MKKILRQIFKNSRTLSFNNPRKERTRMKKNKKKRGDKRKNHL